mmetsp:Transcript_4920/g.14356  ORF Transcript_4920/g.14356 Transcript_4920/m.14356 type:complete len:206 (-) Transcript_4920:1236-1853(-)
MRRRERTSMPTPATQSWTSQRKARQLGSCRRRMMRSSKSRSGRSRHMSFRTLMSLPWSSHRRNLDCACSWSSRKSSSSGSSSRSRHRRRNSRSRHRRSRHRRCRRRSLRPRGRWLSSDHRKIRRSRSRWIWSRYGRVRSTSCRTLHPMPHWMPPRMSLRSTRCSCPWRHTSTRPTGCTSWNRSSRSARPASSRWSTRSRPRRLRP